MREHGGRHFSSFSCIRSLGPEDSSLEEEAEGEEEDALRPKDGAGGSEGQVSISLLGSLRAVEGIGWLWGRMAR